MLYDVEMDVEHCEDGGREERDLAVRCGEEESLRGSYIFKYIHFGYNTIYGVATPDLVVFRQDPRDGDWMAGSRKAMMDLILISPDPAKLRLCYLQPYVAHTRHT